MSLKEIYDLTEGAWGDPVISEDLYNRILSAAFLFWPDLRYCINLDILTESHPVLKTNEIKESNCPWVIIYVFNPLSFHSPKNLLTQSAASEASL